MNGQEKPNFLIFITDQFNPNCLGYAGHPIVRTPHLEFVEFVLEGLPEEVFVGEVELAPDDLVRVLLLLLGEPSQGIHGVNVLLLSAHSLNKHRNNRMLHHIF